MKKPTGLKPFLF